MEVKAKTEVIRWSFKMSKIFNKVAEYSLTHTHTHRFKHTHKDQLAKSYQHCFLVTVMNCQVVILGQGTLFPFLNHIKCLFIFFTVNNLIGVLISIFPL